MLQQTQTARVVQKYEAWLERFPTVQSVADAELSEVLSLWNGLGYNRRAKFLHEACKTICADYGGEVPRTAEELDALPGIGAYTARAICAFAFNTAEVFVETNIRSVFIHEFFENENTLSSINMVENQQENPHSVSDSDILPLVQATLDSENPREWYYALMDYGANLKAQGENPSRRSKSYSRQSKFEGSLRQARGAILRQLSNEAKNQTDEKSFGKERGLTLLEISEREGIDMERLSKAAEKLLEEKMIRSEDGRFFFG